MLYSIVEKNASCEIIRLGYLNDTNIEYSWIVYFH